MPVRERAAASSLDEKLADLVPPLFAELLAGYLERHERERQLGTIGAEHPRQRPRASSTTRTCSRRARASVDGGRGIFRLERRRRRKPWRLRLGPVAC